MKKIDLVQEVAKESGLSLSSARLAVDAVFGVIGRHIKAGDEKIVLPGLGSLVRRRVSPRRARNPRTGEIVEMAARDRLVFRPRSVIEGILKQRSQ